MRDKSGHSEPCTWAEAVQVAGSADALTVGVKYPTWRDWKRRDDVPAYHVLRIAKRRAARTQRLTPEPLARAQRLLDGFYARTGGSGREWDMLMLLLNDDPDVRARRALQAPP